VKLKPQLLAYTEDGRLDIAPFFCILRSHTVKAAFGVRTLLFERWIR
jgi:hypothetical protein